MCYLYSSALHCTSQWKLTGFSPTMIPHVFYVICKLTLNHCVFPYFAKERDQLDNVSICLVDSYCISLTVSCIDILYRQLVS